MKTSYGVSRVTEPQKVMPTSAWRVNNDKEIEPYEMRISLALVHVEGTSFRQISVQAKHEDAAIVDKIKSIIDLRGKLHNPLTDTGGLFYGRVEEIGEDYPNEAGVEVGDWVVANTSLASVPLKIEEIHKIDHAFGQLEVDGYAIVYGAIEILRKPEDLPLNLFLLALNESATLYDVYTRAKKGNKFLVVGNNLITNLLYGYTIRKAVGSEGYVACLIDKGTNTIIKGDKVDDLVLNTFNELYYLNILRPMECLDYIGAYNAFDVSVNCADIPGAETVNILAAKEGGSVIFSNLINNYNIALYLTEAISKEVNIICASGYAHDYGEFDVDIVRELAPHLEGGTVEQQRAERIVKGHRGDEKYREVASEGFICESRSTQKVIDDVMNVSKYDCNVLVTGDTGVGKEKVADLIQKNSSRSMQRFVKVNCASITPTLMESEFFGYEKGAFTGANPGGKKGYFEVADNGMVFLDEVGELPLDMQAKLLRVIQDGQFYRVGGSTPISTNVRIIAATNRDLEEEKNAGRFREDLYYRLNVYPIRVPTLRERNDDIPALVHFFLKKYGDSFGVVKGIDADALEYLKAQQWPGNIRELENIVQRLIVSSRADVITALDVMRELHGEVFDMSADIVEGVNLDESYDLTQMVERFERELIKRAYEECGSTRKAAAHLNISQTQIVRKMRKYGL